MTTIKIIAIDGVPTLALTPEIMKTLGVEINDEVEVFVSDQKLIIGAGEEATRKAKLDKIFADLLVERDSAYRRLAEGVQ